MASNLSYGSDRHATREASYVDWLPKVCWIPVEMKRRRAGCRAQLAGLLLPLALLLLLPAAAVQTARAQQTTSPPLPRKPKPPPLPPLPPKPGQPRGKPPVPPKPPGYDESAATAAKLRLQTERDDAERQAMEQLRLNEDLAERSIAEYESDLRMSAADAAAQAASRASALAQAEIAAEDEADAAALMAEEERLRVTAETAKRGFAAMKAAKRQRAIEEEEAYFKAHGYPHEL